MKIIITGATGFIGRHLVYYFSQNGHNVIALSRNPSKAQILFPSSVTCLQWKMNDPSSWQIHLKNAQAIVNLIGENIFGYLWTNSYKEKLIHSRIDSVRTILRAVHAISPTNFTFIQASAVGYYGNTKLYVDEQARMGNDFLARLSYDWERATDAVADFGVRRIITRFGIVLGKDGGALPRLKLIYRWFLGGTLGSGKQGISWIHIRDVQEGILFLLQNVNLSGVFNFVAPNAVSQKEFSQMLAKTLHRPIFIKTPAFVLKLLLGEMGKSLLLNGQYAKPTALQSSKYAFHFANLSTALQDLVKIK